MLLRDGINEVLLSVNEMPLDEADLIEDVVSATIVNKEIDISRKEVLVRGFKFNRFKIKLSPNTSGVIEIPQSFLTVASSSKSTLVVRDYKLFDTQTMSYKFTEPQNLVVIQDIVFDDLPYPIANYVLKKASLKSYIHIVGSGEDLNIRRAEVQEALIEARRFEARTYRANLVDDEYVSDLIWKKGF